jgi:hypothetical protein
MRKLNENEKVVYEDTLRRNKVARIK